MGKWTRRGLITAGVVSGGALLVGVALRPGNRNAALTPLVAAADETLVNAWVKVATDNTVTVIAPHSEMGQGAQTALAQMLADELDADWASVRVMEAPAADEYANYALGKGFLLGGVAIPKVLEPTVDGAFMQIAKAMKLQITGGSTSIRATGVYGMRVAGAAARQLLVTAAAQAWEVPTDQIQAQTGTLSHNASGRQASYAEFAAAAGALAPPVQPRLKDRKDFTIMGQSVARLDIPAKVDGSAQFGIDAQVPGMKIATVIAPPVFGASVQKLDANGAEGMPGVMQVVNLGDAVAVVADGYWQAQQAIKALDIEWSDSAADSRSSTELFAQFDDAMQRAVDDGAQQEDVRIGDAMAALASAATTVEATYRVPYLAHACMEPMNATVRIEGSQCDVWLGSQNPLGTRYAVAEALGIDGSSVTVHNQLMGGGFGRRATDDAVVQAARIAKAAGVPVKLIWSREEDMRHDHYRPAITSRFSAGLNPAGKPVAWENQYVDKHEPAEAPHIPYAIANQLIHYADSPTHVPFGPWRSVDHSQHGFFTESFIDELADAAGQDPYQYRRSLLGRAPRHLAVLELAAQRADWDAPLPKGRGRGIALQDSFGTVVAQVVEVTVSKGKVSVDRVVCAVDPGLAISPDGLTAQMESGIIFGLTAALYGEIEIRDGAVAQSNFHDYQMVRMDTAPVIETHIVTSDHPIGGAGEPGTPGIAPALANAVFAATGTRVRELPLSKHDLGYRVLETEEVI
ncbi:MAG: molybdopterin cofactor-binding domain-containing protein [Pseudomonadales bacterium]